MKYAINDHTVTVVLNGRPHNITKESGFYDQALAAVRADSEDQINVIVDKIKALKNYVAPVSKVGAGSVELPVIKGNQIYFRGEVVHNAVVDKIFTFMEKQLPFEPLLKFLTKLLDNPSYRSVTQLYAFIEKHQLVIDEDGNVLAWKAVTNDFKDKYSKSINNSPGSVVKVDRNKVSDDEKIGCHFGLHCGNFAYVKSFGNGSDKFILVKVNPKDVVCIPQECSYEKMRVCEYVVVQEVGREEVVAFDNNVRGYVKPAPVTAPVSRPVKTFGGPLAYAAVIPLKKVHNEDKILAEVIDSLRKFGVTSEGLDFKTQLGEDLRFDYEDIAEFLHKVESIFKVYTLLDEFENQMDVSLRDIVKHLKASGVKL